jgi:hypothetical protein
MLRRMRPILGIGKRMYRRAGFSGFAKVAEFTVDKSTKYETSHDPHC